MPTIRLVKSGIEFEVNQGETIMDAAERQRVFLAHNCLNGICRSCITQVLSGVVEHNPQYASYLNIDQFEVEEGYRLLCSAFAHSDAELDK